MSNAVLHLRKVRCARRAVQNIEIGPQAIKQVRTLCGKWVNKRFAVREDKYSWLFVCGDCARDAQGV